MNFITKTGGQGKLYDISGYKESESWHQWFQNQGYVTINHRIASAVASVSSAPYGYQKEGVQVYSKGISGALLLDGDTLNLPLEELQAYQVYMSEILSKAGYVVQLREVKEANDHKTHWIIYMKPSIKLMPVDGRNDQLFGNVHLDLSSDHDFKNASLKLTVHRYADFRFTVGRPFEELLALFGSDQSFI